MKGHDIVRESDRHTVNGNKLQIKKASALDVGVYLCMAENVMGATTSFTRITIGIPPKIDRTTRRNSTIVKGRKLVAFNIGISRTIPVGATVRIYCNSTGLPNPSTSWISEKGTGQRITRSRIQVKFKKNLFKSLLFSKYLPSLRISLVKFLSTIFFNLCF